MDTEPPSEGPAPENPTPPKIAQEQETASTATDTSKGRKLSVSEPRKPGVGDAAAPKTSEQPRKSVTGDLKEKSKGASDEKGTAEPRLDTKFSKDMISIQESKKSILSLDRRVSKDISKEIFTRKKSSRSIGKAVGSIISFRRGSIAEYFDRQKTAKFMNTYKLDSDKPFNVDKVEKILREVLIEALENLTYDTDKVPKQAKWASSMIRAKVKEQEFDRYKLICVVTIGEKRSQDMFSTYRFLWDAERDKHASYVHENMYLFAIAVCFGIYYE